MSSLPVIPMPSSGICPPGYAASPDGLNCLLISAPISVTTTGLSLPEIDPSQDQRLRDSGTKQSGIIGNWVASFWHWPFKHLRDLGAEVFGDFDLVLSWISDLFFAAQGQRNSGFYLLVAALMTDLTGIAVDGTKLFQEFKAKGRVGSMTAIGAALFNALASESAGIEQVDAGSAWKISPGGGVGGLPVHDYAPGDGVKAAQAMLGFATSFAVREGNTDVLADIIPIPWTRLFKDFAEDFSKSLGLARLLRIAIRPLFQIMVAAPLQSDLHVQYRPTLLGVSEAVRAQFIGTLENLDADGDLRKHGYSDTRIEALKRLEERPLPVRYYQTARAARKVLPPDLQLSDDDVSARLAREWHSTNTADAWRVLEDHDPARRVSLLYAEHYVTQFLQGHIGFDAIKQFLDQASKASGVLLTDGEWAALGQLVDSVSVNPVLRIRHLPPLTLQNAYIDGTISLDEYEAHLRQLGFAEADITILTLETLFKAKERAAAAAKKAAKGKTGTSTPGSALPGIGG